MTNPQLAEKLIALIVGHTRAAAIYGDLLELAATRGRLWFFAEYTHTLLTLTWRIVLALFVACVGREFLFDLFHLSMRYTPAAWRTAGGPYLNLLNHAGPLMACIMSILWFVLPFAAVLYGVRDRFVRLTAAIAVGFTIGFWFVPWASAIFVAATLSLAAAAFLSKRWRRPVEALAVTGLVGLLLLAATSGFRSTFSPALPPAVVRYANPLVFSGSLLALALVCILLHRWLLQPPPAANSPVTHS